MSSESQNSKAEPLHEQDTAHLLRTLHGLTIAVNQDREDLAEIVASLARYNARIHEIQVILQQRLLQFAARKPHARGPS